MIYRRDGLLESRFSLIEMTADVLDFAAQPRLAGYVTEAQIRVWHLSKPNGEDGHAGSLIILPHAG